MRRFYILYVIFIMASCKSKDPVEPDSPESVQTPVTVTSILQGPMEDSIELSATSTFLLKNDIKANANGYLQSAHVMPGQFVKAGQTLFTVKTKEAESIGNAVNMLDTSFKFSGTNAIKAGAQGFISQLNHQSGDYVQDGEQLAVISDAGSFVFLMEMPYALKADVSIGKRVDIILPDNERLAGTVSSEMPTVEAASQTQHIVIKVNTAETIPENLVAKVRLLKTLSAHSVSLPRSAVLSNETQSSFWVMKMLDSITAAKVPVKKGIETKDRIEILSPVFTPDDKILLTGNYGLDDTVKVRVIQP